MLRIGTVFSGIGDFEQALKRLQPIENERLNCLLQSKLYAEFAKEKIREYKKLEGEL